MIPRLYTGIAARNIAATHLRAIAFVMLVLLTVAIAIDLAKTVDGIRAQAVEDGRVMFALMGEYLWYRAVDIVARMLPMACLAGSFLAELLRHQRMENVILATAGAPPTLTFAALLAVAAVTGSVQVTLEGWLRPKAVFAQVDLQLGAYAARFQSGDLGTQWIVEGDRAIQARILRSDTPELRDVRVFEGVGQTQLRRVISAARAVPSQTPGNWVLYDATVWSGAAGNPGSPMRATHHAKLPLALSMTTAHLRYYGIYGFYLPNAPLRQIAALKGTVRAADAQTALVRRFTALFLPGVFAFLGASLAQAGRNGRFFAWWRLLALGTFGYVCVVSVKTFWSLGEFAVLSPLAATAVPLIFAIGVGIAIQLKLNGAPQRQASKTHAQTRP